MAEQISPISPETRLAQILGDDYLAQAPGAVPGPAQLGEPNSLSGSPFEDVLSTAITALNSVSRSEVYANQMVNSYLKGEVELHEVMVAQSKASIMIQLAVTTLNSAVTTFKEITQMQV